MVQRANTLKNEWLSRGTFVLGEESVEEQIALIL